MKGRYNITLTPEMDEKLNRHAYLTRKSRSSLIEEALEQYLTGSGDNSRFPDGDEISILKERIEAMEAKLHKIETKEGSGPILDLSGSMVSLEKTPLKLPQTPTTRTSNNPQPNDDAADEEMQSALALDPEGWYTQSLVCEFLDQSILPSTRKSIVSLAVARGEMETNGKKRKGCRIKGSSVISWIISMRKKEKPPVFFLGSP